MKHSRLTISVKLTLALLMLGGWTTAQAATISYTHNWNTSKSLSTSVNVDNQLDFLDNIHNVTVAQFDPSLGILTRAEIQFGITNYISSASANFRDDVSGSNVGGLQNLFDMKINFLGPNFVDITRNVPDRLTGCAGSSGPFNASLCSTSLPSENFQVFGAASAVYNVNAPSNQFLFGLGTYNIEVIQRASLFTDETDGGNGYVDFRSANVQASGNIWVTYEYTVVPVPAATWLFGSGLIGLVGAARRKKS